MRSRAAAVLGVLLGVVVVLGPALLLPGVSARAVRPAGADVARLGGYSARVDGYQGWFGSYDMAGMGPAWCVDHGIAAPDADHRYLPTELAEALPATRTAMAWALGRHGNAPDRVTAAALTLVLHDLMGAPYPSGPLDLGRLGPAQLSGFDGRESDVLARARAIKADATAHSGLRGPLTLRATVSGVGGGSLRPGRDGVLVARLTDAVGAGVPGVELAATATGATLVPDPASATDGSGEQRFPFVAGVGQNRFRVSGVVPDLALQAFAPSTRRAQRVARPGRVPVSAGASATAQSRRLSIRKTGDASAYLPLAGARFQVRPVGSGGDGPVPALVGELVTGADGASRPLELDPGVYRVSEVAAPPGYTPAGPWTADLTSGDVVLEAANAAVPGRASVAKVDAGTGRGVAGATLRLLYDADRDGAYETSLGQWVSDAEPTVRDLRPGDYEVREVAAPDGYAPSDRLERFSVAPGRVADVVVANARLPAALPPPSSSPPLATGPTFGSPRPQPARARPAVERLPDTGQPLSTLLWVGITLVAGGVSMEAATSSPALRARRRARRLCFASPPPRRGPRR